LDDIHKTKEWKLDQIKKSTEEHVVYTWGATDATREGAFAIKRGEHIYVEDFEGKKYIDLSSQAINNNLGYTIPKPVLEAVTKQL
jgi:4-aminobutyrate aminotransferase-like enzyme